MSAGAGFKSLDYARQDNATDMQGKEGSHELNECVHPLLLMVPVPSLLLSSRSDAAIFCHDPDQRSYSRQTGQMHDVLVHHAETAR